MVKNLITLLLVISLNAQTFDFDDIAFMSHKKIIASSEILLFEYATASSFATFANASDTANVATRVQLASSASITAISVLITRISGGAGTAADFKVIIYSGTSTTIDSFVAESTTTKVHADITTSASWYSFSFSPTSVSSGYYWIGLTTKSSVNSLNYYNWSMGGFSSGDTKKSTDGTTWLAHVPRAGNIKIYGTL